MPISDYLSIQISLLLKLEMVAADNTSSGNLFQLSLAEKMFSYI